MAMKLSLFSTGFSAYPLERTFEVAARCGYDCVDIGGFRPHAFAPDLAKGGAEKIRALSKKYNMPVYSYVPENTGSPYSLVFEDDAMNEESLAYFKLTLEMTKAIGAEACMLACNHPGLARNREDVKKRFISNMRILAKHAETVGTTILLEPVTPFEGTIVTNSEDVRWALGEIDSPACQCVLDLACPLTCGEPISEYFEKLGGAVKQLHFIDCCSNSEDHLIPGDGEMDFPRIASYLKRIKFDGVLSLELFSRYANEPDFSAERGIEVIRDLLK